MGVVLVSLSGAMLLFVDRLILWLGLGVGLLVLPLAVYRQLNPLKANVGDAVAVLVGLDTREGVVTALNDDGYQVATERGEVAVNRHDLLRVRS
ncbi:MAG: hypothetical protein DI536_34830 [Archangium gephyra]|uniref:Uncharacterized protein n=1 Tax=Archangium gephyra TaxID=48 RepID=A0A2W5U5M9_9BACT|nr:MAG: hypothetical protein DI536_34830 [Archangium gephyra]